MLRNATELALQVAIEAIIDICEHILAIKLIWRSFMSLCQKNFPFSEILFTK